MSVKAAFFDVDGTLTTERVWRGIMEYFARRGERRWTHRFFWAYHLPVYFLYKLKLVPQSSFRRPWAAHLAWFVRGFSIEEAEPVWDWVTDEYLQPFWRQDALDLIDAHKNSGDLVVLVSAGPTPLEMRIARRVGADFAIGTDFEQTSGAYTGRISGPVCIEAQKADLARKAISQRNLEIDFAASKAYADSAGDVHLLEMVGSPVAFHPDDELRPIAGARGWRVIG
ncbi:MAG: HAD family hydrolase [Anaerolineales bacterium]